MSSLTSRTRRAVGRAAHIWRWFWLSVGRRTLRRTIIIELSFENLVLNGVPFWRTVFRRSIATICVIIVVIIIFIAVPSLMFLICVDFRPVNCLNMFSERRGIGVFFDAPWHFADIRLFIGMGSVLMFCPIASIWECLWTAGKFTRIGLFPRMWSQMGLQVLQTWIRFETAFRSQKTND